MDWGGKAENKKGVTVQEKAVGAAEEEIGVFEMVGSTEVEEREPTLLDLMSILQAHMGQQEAQKARQEHVNAKDENLKHCEISSSFYSWRTSAVPDLPCEEQPHIFISPQAEATQTLSGQFPFHETRLEKLTDSDDIEHF